jgi:hypothetical protein
MFLRSTLVGIPQCKELQVGHCTQEFKVIVLQLTETGTQDGHVS